MSDNIHTLFGDRPIDKGTLPEAFVYFEKGELYELVADAEEWFSDLLQDADSADQVEMFTHPDHSGKLLVNVLVDTGRRRGVYYVAAGTYKLVLISREPLELEDLPEAAYLSQQENE